MVWLRKTQRRIEGIKRKPAESELINACGSKKLRKLEVDGFLYVLNIEEKAIKRLRNQYLEQGINDVIGFVNASFMTLCVNLEDDDKKKIPFALRSKVLEYAGILKGVI